MGELRVMVGMGDLRVMWNPDNKAEVAAAREQFDSLRAKGHLAYKVNKEDGSKAEQITSFDKKAGKIILAPPMSGG